MACTPDQIKEKRNIALAKLKARQLKYSSPTNDPNQNATTILQQITPQNYKNTNFNSKSLPSTSFKAHSSKPYEKPKVNSDQFYGSKVSKVIIASCTLISETRFEVVPNGYHQKIVDVFKTVPSSKYNATNKTWNFFMHHYDVLLSKMKVLQPEVVVDPLPKFVVSLFKLPQLNNGSVDFSRIEPELLDTLMPFQKDGVCFGVNNKGRCLIADEMGLGKTFQALAIASYYRDDWPVLIVTTSSMRNIWQKTIYEHLPSVPLACTLYMTTGKDYINDAQILIISHDLMSRCLDKLKQRHFGVLIIDESHVIKNFKAKLLYTLYYDEKQKREKLFAVIDYISDSRFLIACKSGNIKIVEQMIIYGANIYARNIYGEGGIHMATYYHTANLESNDMSLLMLLLSAGCPVNVPSNTGCTPLHIAAGSEKYCHVQEKSHIV
ncbi:Marcal1 [Carabus blaptoides fortunei]